MSTQRPHTEIERLLAIYRDLSVEERQQVMAHARHCAACAETLQAYREMDKHLAYTPLHHPDQSLRATFYANTHRRRRLWGWFLSFWSVLPQRLFKLPVQALEIALFIGLIAGAWFALRNINQSLLRPPPYAVATSRSTISPLFPKHVIDEPDAIALSVALSEDGSVLATGLYDGKIQLWRTTNGKLLHTIEASEEPVTRIAFAPDGTTLASSYSRAGVIDLWRVKDGTHLHRLNRDAGNISHFAFTRQSNKLVAIAGEKESQVFLWRVADGALLQTLVGYRHPITSMAFSPDGSTLAFALEGGPTGIQILPASVLRLWQISEAKLLPKQIVPGLEASVSHMAFAPDGDTLVATMPGYALQLWSLDNHALRHTLAKDKEAIRPFSQAFSPDGSLLVQALEDGTVSVWRVADGTLLRRWMIQDALGMSLTFTAGDQLLLAAITYDGKIWVWEEANHSR